MDSGNPAAALRVPWHPGEFCRLEVVQGAEGEVAAIWEMQADLGGESSWLLRSGVTTEGVSPSPGQEGGTVFEEWCTVETDALTLLPRRVHYRRRHGARQVTYTAVYAEEKVRIEADLRGTAGGGRAATAEIVLPPPPYFDNEQFVPVLRALPLSEGFQATISTIITKSGSKIPVTVEVSGKEQLTVPAGTYQCWVVELKGMGQKAWVACEPPHEPVRFTNEDAKTDSRLTLYHPGDGGCRTCGPPGP